MGYIQARLSHMLRTYNYRAMILGRGVKTSQVFMTLTTGATTLIAALQQVDLRYLVPVMVSLNALVSQCSEFERFPTRLVNVRKSIEILTGLQVWWAGLNDSERRHKPNILKLVSKTEDQADAEIAAWKKSTSVEAEGDHEKEEDEKNQ